MVDTFSLKGGEEIFSHSNHRPIAKSCVSEILQSQVWGCGSGAVRRQDALGAPFPYAQDGMRTTSGVNAVTGAGEP